MVTLPESMDVAPTLPRPMAIYSADPDAGEIVLVYGTLGNGTRRMSRWTPSSREPVVLVGPLGQGFTLQDGTRHLLLLGRGIGTCSLVPAAGLAVRRGVSVTAVDSARSEEALVVGGAYDEIGATRWAVTDADGSSDAIILEKRLIRTFNDTGPEQIAVCGSTRLAELARRLGARWGSRVEVSIEAHMACGLGYCHGCSRGDRTASSETPLVCCDGPTFLLNTRENISGGIK
ncbi:dihydroorotate oxidase electron transfer subunit [Ornithinimicrobium sp. W1665]|uniref:iron-sulfur cluster-binding protein n=1 Tax=Ornithinimicrobium sp. W1665 TaxID=3416666 RepID=UPI003CFB0F5F